MSELNAMKINCTQTKYRLLVYVLSRMFCQHCNELTVNKSREVNMRTISHFNELELIQCTITKIVCYGFEEKILKCQA